MTNMFTAIIDRIQIRELITTQCKIEFTYAPSFHFKVTRLRGYQPVDEHESVLNFRALLPGYEVTGFRRLHGYRIAKSSTYLAISIEYIHEPINV